MLRGRATTRTITPQGRPVRLGGYAAGDTASVVASPLEVNCLALTDGAATAVIVSLDLLYVTHALREAVLAGVADFGIAGPNLFMAASHTHYAPAMDETKPKLGTPEFGYRDQVAATIIEAVRDAALGPKAVVSLATASGDVEIGVNRRKRRAVRLVRGGIEINKVAMCPNPSGPTDPVVSVVAVRTGDRTVAYLWSAACHPTGLDEGDRINAHWPGVVRDELRQIEPERRTGGGSVPVLFLQGFSGDVRPPSGRAKRGLLTRLVRRMRLGPVFELLDPEEYRRWSGSAAGRVATIARDCTPLAGQPTLRCARIEVPATQFALGAEGLPPVSFHGIIIGDISLLGASAELVSGYASRVRAMASGSFVIPVGCLDHVIGYWPTHDMFRDGGYEVTHHCPSFGINSCNPNIEATVLEQFSLLLAAASPADLPQGQ